MNKIFKIIFFALLSSIFIHSIGISDEEKIKIGLLVPMTGDDKDLGQSIIKSTRMALQDIGNDKLEIYPKDTSSDPDQTLKSAIELKNIGIKIVIGPIFYKSLSYLDNVRGYNFSITYQ